MEKTKEEIKEEIEKDIKDSVDDFIGTIKKEPCCEYFSDKTGRSVSFYIRHVLNPEKSVGSLVFDGQHLRSGFSGEIIPLK